jgi:LysM repeat protein
VLRSVLIGVLAALLLGPTGAAASSTYVVRPGDNLTTIAATYGVTVAAIQQANGLSSPNRIYVGQTLLIPDPTPAAAPPATGTYVVQPGDTLSGIAARFGSTVPTLMAANALPNPNYIWVGQRLRIPGAGPGTPPSAPPAATPGRYTVQPGDTLTGIANRYGVTVAALAAVNGITNPSRILVGTVLQIPTGGSTPGPVPSGGGGRVIDVNLSTQQLLALDGGSIVYRTAVSTGVPAHPTPVGTFRIYDKRYSDNMAGGQAAEAYYLPNVPYVMYFYAGGYAIHGTYWHHNFGTPMSHGCINLPTDAAAWVFAWAPLGTPVTIHW